MQFFNLILQIKRLGILIDCYTRMFSNKGMNSFYFMNSNTIKDIMVLNSTRNQ